MKDFVIECGELLQHYIPWLTWEEAMEIITSKCAISKQIQDIVRRRRYENNYESV